jgi:hypothetical protein
MLHNGKIQVSMSSLITTNNIANKHTTKLIDFIFFIIPQLICFNMHILLDVVQIDLLHIIDENQVT